MYGWYNTYIPLVGAHSPLIVGGVQPWGLVDSARLQITFDEFYQMLSHNSSI